MNLCGKKILIMGGAFQHCKLVEAAHEMGVKVYVVDYLPLDKAPAKQIADKHYELNITDYDSIIELCKAERIDGVLASHLDACQIPYQNVCNRLGVPCFGDSEQFKALTDKTTFLECCKKYGVDIIPQYSEEEILTNKREIEYPIFVKPCDSRGSRGQTVCYSPNEVKGAIEFAKNESKLGKVVIEKYMVGKQDFSMSYLMIDGNAYLVRTGDRFLGKKEDGMDKSAILGVSPSENLSSFLRLSNDNVINMIKGLGIQNGPVFMQGFIDGDRYRFYDPGLRFPGIEYDRMYEYATGVNLCKALVEFALTGKISEEYKAIDPRAELNGKIVANLFIPIIPGKIKYIEGIETLKKSSKILSFFQKYYEGDIVGAHYNVNQRFCEVDIVADNRKELADTIDWVYSILIIKNENGHDMKMSMFNTSVLRGEAENESSDN